MTNQEQVRASNALKALRKRPELNKGQREGDALTGFPALIIGNGLLATIAFSQAKGAGYPLICDAIAEHLACREMGLLPPDSGSVKAMAQVLSDGDSEQLRLCTAEALVYLNYLRRFAKAKA